MKKLTFVTGNKKKLEQVKEYLQVPIKHHALDLMEIQSTDLKEIAEHKAKEAYKKLNSPVLIEDVSLRFNNFRNLPGPLVKWFIKEIGLEKMCRLLDHSPDRSAVAEIMYAYYDGDDLTLIHSETPGTISQHPQGDESFGWNAIFIPDGETRTWGEMNNEEKKKDSMRAKALIKLEDYLKKHEE